MKIVLNRCYGGFWLSAKAEEILGWSFDDGDPTDLRTDPRLIDLIEKEGSEFCSRSYGSNLVVAEISDTATDWVITENDGFESIFYVVDGKIREV